MEHQTDFEIFLVATPGLEPVLCAEALSLGFAGAVAQPGGVGFRGGWPEVWRANLEIRGATRVLVRIGSFRAMHLAQLDKRARKFPWAETLRPDVPVKVEVTCRSSRIYHAGAAAQRIETALREELGVTVLAPPRGAAKGQPVEAAEEDAADIGDVITLKVRIEDDLCTISLDTSGESLHRRGHKEAVNKAPMRETLASLFLRQCGFDGTQTLVDPMCGSGTFVIEAAEIAAGLKPGRSRGFAFEKLASFDAKAWAKLRAPVAPKTAPALRFFGSDRDAGAVRMSIANAARAGVSDRTEFALKPVSELTPPEGPPGLVMVNPPYGTRIGNKKLLFGLYGAFGQVLKAQFSGWRVGMVTSDPSLAKAAGLPFTAGPPVAHGGLKVHLYQTPPLR